MSSIFSELRRSERLLPVEDAVSFRQVSSWRPLFVDPHQQPALHEHVAFFRSSAGQRSRWMYTVRSARVSTRQVPFVSLTKSTSTTAVTTGGIMNGDDDYADDGTPVSPPLLVCRRRVAALGPYESLMCPTLLFSPVRLAFAKRMISVALRLSLPVQEVFLFLSLTFVYLDVVMSVTLPRPLNFQQLTDALKQHQAQRFEAFVRSCDDAPHRRHAFTTVLNAVIELWKERRESTVSACFPLGVLTTPIRLRDIDNTVYSAFVPVAPRDTKRENHPFCLPPLDADLLVSQFVPTWERILHAASRDISVLATLHEYILRSVSPPMAHIKQTHPIVFNIFASMNGLPISKEELADFLCRLGSSLWSSLDMTQSIVLSKPQLQFVSKVLGQEFFATSLLLRHRGVQELRVRRVTLGDLALTVIHDDGREAEVGRPAGFFLGQTTMGDNVAKSETSPKDGSNAADNSNISFWLVAEGGIDVVRTFLQHLIRSGHSTTSLTDLSSSRHDGDRRCSAADDDKIGSRQPLSLPSTPSRRIATFGNESFAVLSRAEEGVLYRILQSHPHALYLAGCGVQQLLVRMTDGHTFLRRVCGAVVPWDVCECYDPSQGLKLRQPARIVTAGAPFHPPEGISPPRCTLKAVRGMVRHYAEALASEQRRAAQSHRPAVTVTTLFPVDRAVALYVLRHHPHYYTRLLGCGIAEVCVQQRQQRQQQRGRRRQSAGRGSSLSSVDSEAVKEKEDDEAVTEDASEYVSTLAITHPCGGTTFFAYEDCYNPVTNRLNQPQLLDRGGGGGGALDVTNVVCSSRVSQSRKRSLSP